MKKISLLLLAFTLIFASCAKDDDDASGQTVLQYDGGDVSGPLLSAGVHEAAVLFPASVMTAHIGKRLTEVDYFMGAQPAGASVNIYGPGTNGEPGDRLYFGDVTNAIRVQEWNTHVFSNPITIDGTDLWIAVGLLHNVQQQSIGCDAGPSNANGDWLYQDSDNSWRTYRERTNESVNWNIRGILENE